MVYENPEITSVRITKKTHAKLTEICLKQESYDDLLNRLMHQDKEDSKETKSDNKIKRLIQMKDKRVHRMCMKCIKGFWILKSENKPWKRFTCEECEEQEGL